MSSEQKQETLHDDSELRQICKEGFALATEAIEHLENLEKELEEQGLLEDD